MEPIDLDAIEQRVIGSLLEKEVSVPASYPMTLNALKAACNQASSRDPVLDYGDATITDAIDHLKARGLARIVHASHGSRVVKYRQVLDERLELSDADRALLTVLLLRGPQAAGELRTRTDRLHRFGDRSDVEAALADLATLDPPLVQELERQPGQQDPRWIHLLGPVDLGSSTSGGAGPGGSGPALAPGEATEAVLAEGPSVRTERVRSAYDTIAASYADNFADELHSKPLDRWLLERLVDLADGGPVADAGCGPGHTTFHLAAAGAEVTGFDLSPAMVDEARRRYPELAFEVGDLTALPSPSGDEAGRGWAAIAAWYSMVHLAASELPPAAALLAGALRPGGWLAFALHLGDDTSQMTEFLGHEIDLTFARHHRDRVLDAVATAGLVDVEWYHRGPYAEAEVETERLYVLVRRPA